MIEYPFDAAKAASGNGLFPPEIENHNWVLFHGSSGQYLDAIAREGLRTTDDAFSRSELSGLCAVFERLNWHGLHGGGYAVLKPFSVGQDRATSERPPIYLAESSTRALLYASAEWAGGEAARAVRHAIEDLNTRTDLLQAERALMSVLGAKAKASANKHTFGVVYALLFEASNLADLVFANGMGVKTFACLPPSHIMGLIKVPGGWVQTVGPDKRRIERLFEDGIVAKLREAS